eukprot:TRINITY_DN1900_c0_g6_i1.p1 TRINITY_DN1900_c0_g6~~TRINITY_DN1900_c0_g6_i1.p1  ORF type:complete len:932 (+),score=129.59 TRINITY_DN1900_c0_g6_i1:47-2842(+)
MKLLWVAIYGALMALPGTLGVKLQFARQLRRQDVRVSVTTGVISCSDQNIGQGFMMYSAQDINARWNKDSANVDFRYHTAINFVCVRYQDNQWQYDCNWEDEGSRSSRISWHQFTPLVTDTLVASIDFTYDTVSLLQGGNNAGPFQGIQRGYREGDLQIFANQGADGTYNNGEFRMLGSWAVFYSVTTTTTTTATTSTTSTTSATTTTTTTTATTTTTTTTSTSTSATTTTTTTSTTTTGTESTTTTTTTTASTTSSTASTTTSTSSTSTSATTTTTGVTTSTTSASTTTTTSATTTTSTSGTQTTTTSATTTTTTSQSTTTTTSESTTTSTSATTTTDTTTTTTSDRHSTTTTTRRVGSVVRLSTVTGALRCTDLSSGFIMYTEQYAHQRFNVHIDQRTHVAKNFVCVRFHDYSWQYYSGSNTWLRFANFQTDILVAKVLQYANIAVDLKGTDDKYMGIQLGYAEGDLGFFPKQNADSTTTLDEILITGSWLSIWVSRHPTTTTMTLASTTTTTTEELKVKRVFVRGGGLVCSDDSNGFIMYSATQIDVRFPKDEIYNATFAYPVRDNSIEYTATTSTTPRPIPRRSLRQWVGYPGHDYYYRHPHDGYYGGYGGYGYDYGGYGGYGGYGYDYGNYYGYPPPQRQGRQPQQRFFLQESQQTNRQDQPEASENLVCVRYHNYRWQYLSKWARRATRKYQNAWRDFNPAATDILLAEVLMYENIAVDLRGKNTKYMGIQLGYASGDVTFKPKIHWIGSFKLSEIQVAGTFIDSWEIGSQVPVAGGMAVQTGGLACSDRNVGYGFLMFTRAPVNDRWKLDTTQNDFRWHVARNFVCVRNLYGKWQYDTNWEDEADRVSRISWHDFTPLPTDILVASVDFTRDSVSDLKGTNEKYLGIQQGYADGDLTYYANQAADGTRDLGEFRITGGYILPFR